MPSTSKIMMSSSAKRAAVLILPLSMMYLYILKDVLPLTATLLSNYEQTARTGGRPSQQHDEQYSLNNFTLKAMSVAADDNVNNNIQSSFERSNRLAITKEQLPIYLLGTSNNTNESVSSAIPWGTLVTAWNRTATYSDLMTLADSITYLPPVDRNKRSVIMLHCGPKSGSTTLRVACRKNLEATCGITSPKREPKGYMDETILYPLIRSCTRTHHFCTKETIMPINVPVFNDTTFIHMFPFRTYDEWARSALKQAFDRGGQRGCDSASKLISECVPSRMEIDFRKYGKTDLSNFKEVAVQRMNDYNESHIFILYHHRELEKVLQILSGVYNVPNLPGSDGHGKLKRPEGTCDDGILDRYHDCFSHQLMELK